MKVRTKITLLLFAVVGVFIGGLGGIKAYESQKFRAISAIREEERRVSFDEFLRHWSEPLQTFVNDFSVGDGMVASIDGTDRNWVENNLSDDTLISYRTHAVWAYKPDGTLAFTRNVLYSDALPEAPLPKERLTALAQEMPRCHFFARTALGLMEISGAAVRPSKTAPAQSRAAHGYFFAGRLWSNADLRDMSIFTGNTITFGSPGHERPLAKSHFAPEKVSFTRVLSGSDGQPLALLSVNNESPVVEELNLASQRLLVCLIAFAVLLFLVLVLSLNIWVNSPLKKLSKCLRMQDVECLRPLQPKRDEFGDLARLMGAFFEQRQALIRETAERHQTEEALHESEERLRHSQKMDAVGRLAGGIAHDFNNLLTAIIGYADLIASRSLDEKTSEEAGLIRKAGDQAADLTRQLLAFSRKQILQPRVIDLNVLVREMEKLLRRVIGEQITLQVEMMAEEARVCADPTQLEQVLLNLGVNARDAMPRGGVLTMRTAAAALPCSDAEGTGALRPGSYLTLTVQDTGCGMDAETKARIFEPFFTTKGPGKGTGLGLSTVYGVVRQSGGTICVDSKPGVGTSFTIYLPRAEGPVSPAKPKPQRPEMSRLRETVLVIEDEEMVRELVCAVLTDQGYEVICAPDGPEGLRLAREHHGAIDLLVSDVIMPGMTGPEVARTLLQSRPRMKVLYISGYSDADISEGGILSPAVLLLEKPFTPEALSRRVREVLDEAAEPHPASALVSA